MNRIHFFGPELMANFVERDGSAEGNNRTEVSSNDSDAIREDCYMATADQHG